MQTPKANKLQPLRSGLALAVTVAVFYGLCTILWVLFRTQFLTFMNNLFHGLNFTNLITTEPFSMGGFVYAVAVISFWAVLIGSFYEWLRRRLLA